MREVLGVSGLLLDVDLTSQELLDEHGRHIAQGTCYVGFVRDFFSRKSGGQECYEILRLAPYAGPRQGPFCSPLRKMFEPGSDSVLP